MDRLTAAKVFVETVERGSASAAAEALGMSRAMASRYLAALEGWTDARLLHRTTRRLSLTSAGERVLELSRELVRVGSSLEDVAGRGGDLRGQLRVAAATILCEELLVPLLSEFLRANPGVSIDLRASDRPVDLVEDRIDVAIRIGSGLDPAAIARKLSETASVLCASPAYRRQRGVPDRPDELAAHDCLTYTNFGSEEWTLLRDGDQANVPVHGPFRTNDALALRRAALTGLGIAMLPRFAVEALLASGDLERVLPGWEPRVLPIHALYLSRQHLPAAARALIDHLVGRLQSNDVTGTV